MRSSRRRALGVGVVLFLLCNVLLFQNCSGQGFSALDSLNGANSSGSSDVPGSSRTASMSAAAAVNVNSRYVFKEEGVTSGGLKVGAVWTARDFALHLVNPNKSEIRVEWKMKSNTNDFLFRGGQRGTWIGEFKIPAMTGFTRNVTSPNSIYSDPDSKINDIPVLAETLFEGEIELSSDQPFYSYTGNSFRTGSGTGVTFDDAWYDAWSHWAGEVPATYDVGLQAIMIPYTNLWQNDFNWINGWHSELTIHNNSDVPVTYTVKHYPDDYANWTDSTNQRVCSLSSTQHYQQETATVTVDGKGTVNIDLRELFGWGKDRFSNMEGFLLVSAPKDARNHDTLMSSSSVTARGLPNSNSPVSGACSLNGCTVPELPGQRIQQGQFNIAAGFKSATVPAGKTCQPDSYQGDCSNGIATLTHQPAASSCVVMADSSGQKSCTLSLNGSSASTVYINIGGPIRFGLSYTGFSMPADAEFHWSSSPIDKSLADTVYTAATNCPDGVGNIGTNCMDFSKYSTIAGDYPRQLRVESATAGTLCTTNNIVARIK